MFFDKSLYMCYVFPDMNTRHVFLIWAIGMILGANNATAQAGDKKSRRTTPMRSDSVAWSQTRSHDIPMLGGVATGVPKPPRHPVVFSHPNDAVALDFMAAANMGRDTIRAIFASNIIIRPFVRFNNNITIGANADITFYNTISRQVSSIVQQMYLYTAMNTQIGEFKVCIGRIPAFNRPDDFKKHSGIYDHLLNKLYFEQNVVMPRGATITYDNDETVMTVGYVEHSNGVWVSGDGDLMVAIQQKIGDNFKIDGVILDMLRNVTGNLQFVYSPTARDNILVQIFGIPNKMVWGATYKHGIKNLPVTACMNGFVARSDGRAGANVGIYHNSTGAYVLVGAIQNTINENKWDPIFEIGIFHQVFPRRSK